jgi:hypothetical protein
MQKSSQSKQAVLSSAALSAGSIWFSASAGGDLLIAAVMMHIFASLRRQYTATTIGFKKYAYRALASGSVSASVAVLALILFRTVKGNAVTGVAQCLGMIYGLTLVLSLNYRHVDLQDPSSSSLQNVSAYASNMVPLTPVSLEHGVAGRSDAGESEKRDDHGKSILCR